MRIKKDPLTKNEYIAASGMWVRNFTKKHTNPLNTNLMIDRSDYHLLLKNEETNNTQQISPISEEQVYLPKIVIVSDGYDFEKRHRLVASLPKDVGVIAVNGALTNWKLSGSERPINLYVANNPYKECLSYLPKKGKYFPSCVVSSWTNPQFSKAYQGRLYMYEPTPTRYFGVERHQSYYIDDYRNPVCAAIGLAYQFGVEKLLLLCCDDSFDEERPAAVQMKNGLWTYPQHFVSHSVIDANLYWLTHQEETKVVVGDYSCGPEYQNAVYIANEEGTTSFFDESKEES